MLRIRLTYSLRPRPEITSRHIVPLLQYRYANPNGTWHMQIAKVNHYLVTQIKQEQTHLSPPPTTFHADAAGLSAVYHTSIHQGNIVR